MKDTSLTNEYTTGIGYMLCSIFFAILTGAVWGSLLLLKISKEQSFTTASIFDINAHGYMQVFGWTGLFIMGLIYLIIPNLWKTKLKNPSLAYVALGCAISGALIRTIGMTSSLPSLMMIGSTLMVASATIFSAQILLTYKERKTAFEPYCAYLFTSIACFFLMSIGSGWHSWNILTASSFKELVWYIATFQAPLRNLQIHGFMLFMLFGISIKIFPTLFHLPKISEKRAWGTWILFTIALLTEITFFLIYRLTGIQHFASAMILPWTLYCVGTVNILRIWHLSKPFKNYHLSNQFIRQSYYWLIISLILLVSMPLYRIMSGIAFSHAYYGAIRHLITVGFISLFLMGISIRIFNPNSRDTFRYNVAFYLINIGCFLRVTLQILTDWTPLAFKLVAISGILELTAFVLWGGSLAITIYNNPLKVPSLKNKE